MKGNILTGMALGILLAGCTAPDSPPPGPKEEAMKINVYQVFTRLFGNTNTSNKAWGTLEENGVGKFNDFSDEALEAIKSLGITHIWYTGVLHHAMVTDYSAYGLPGDDPDVVKGRAGSPYSVKDYYNVNPDLATDPAKRLEEFEALIERTHNHEMKVIIDIVPNHVARVYHSVSNPEREEDFGASDDRSREYLRDNNFYYIPGQPFRVPQWREGYRVLGGEDHPRADTYFKEDPARWTGNGSRSPQPDMNDWYEAVKINFGVDPEGKHDFEALPAGYEHESCQVHHDFWKDKQVPDSWKKFRAIALYWLDKGVDGFRYDMAEMVPVEFWSYLNSAIKITHPEAFLLAEIYQPHIYRDYIGKGKMDFLYDKVQLYDSLKSIMQGHGSTDAIVQIQEDLADIEYHMLHFLENHDEQRIASPEFAGDALKGMPAMVVSATIGSSPTMLYFGQHVGEPGVEEPGFGAPSRTSIYDYMGVPHHQRWMNHGKFDGAPLSEKESKLNEFYGTLLNFTKNSQALTGKYREIHRYNRKHTPWYNDRVFSYVRWKEEERLIIVANFDADSSFGFKLRLPGEILSEWNLGDGNYILKDQLSDQKFELLVSGQSAETRIDLEPLQSLILQVAAD
ncbi:MAG: alpha-amylase family protein [Bacteroidales bacterium]|nr:alpha-amylase family protein [Bacteroidales bacterium]